MKPLISISWSNLLLSIFIIILLLYVGIKIVKFILKVLLNTKTKEKITDVYDKGNERLLSSKEVVDAFNNKLNH